MKDDVKICVDSRVDFIVNYLDITPDNRDEFEKFVNDITALGERCGDYSEFENRFASEGLSDRFNSMVGKFPQKTHKMTKEEKDFSKATFRQMLKDNKEEIISDIVGDAADTARIHAEGELIAKNRERMIEEGVYDDYTIASNTADDIRTFFGLFKKRKK